MTGWGDVFINAGSGITKTFNAIDDMNQTARTNRRQDDADAQARKVAMLDAFIKGQSIQKGENELKQQDQAFTDKDKADVALKDLQDTASNAAQLPPQTTPAGQEPAPTVISPAEQQAQRNAGMPEQPNALEYAANPLKYSTTALAQVAGNPAAKETIGGLEKQATLEEQKRKDLADTASKEKIAEDDRQARADAERRHTELMLSIQAGKQPDKEDISYLAGEIRAGRMSPVDLRTYLPAGLAGGKARSDALRMASEGYNEDHPGEHMDPSRLQRDYQNFKLPKTTQALTAVETFLPNIDRLEGAINQLPPGAPLKSLNALMQSGEVQIGNTAATNVKMLKGLLSHELGSSLGGGASLSDERIKMALDALGTDSPKEAALNALGVLRQVEVNRHVNVALSGGVYGENYLRGIYGEDTANKLIANEKASRQSTGKVALGKSQGGGAAAGGLPKIANEAEYNALPPGQYIDPNGNTRTKK